MKLSGVRPSVCPSVCPIIRPPHARCGGFAAVGPAARRCRSTAAANASSATLSADVGSWTRKLCVCVAGVHALRPHRGQCIVANRFRSLLPSSIHPSQISGQHLAVYIPGCSSGSNSDDLYRAAATTYAFHHQYRNFAVPSPVPSTHLGIWACGST